MLKSFCNDCLHLSLALVLPLVLVGPKDSSSPHKASMHLAPTTKRLVFLWFVACRATVHSVLSWFFISGLRSLSLSIFSFWGRLQESYSCRRLHILGQQTPSLKMLSLASHLCTIWEGLGVWPELQHLESIWSQAKPNKAAEETHKNTNATPQVQSDDSGFKNNRVATLSCGWKVSVGSTKIQSPRHIHQNPSRHCH